MIVRLLETLEKNPATVFRKKDLLSESKEQFAKLKTQGFLTYLQPDPHHETYPCCTPCIKACPMDVVNMEGKLFAICPEDTYELNHQLHFMGEQIIKGINTAFILALFANVQAAESHLLSLPSRIPTHYERIIVVTPSLSLTQEPIYAKLRNVSLFPVTLPPSFGQRNFKINYIDAIRKRLPEENFETTIPIDDKELTILVELADGTDKTLSQVEIAAATSIKRGTVKDKLPRLEKLGFVHRPLGKRKGYQITQKGKDITQRNL